MGLKRCEKCGEDVPESKAFCSGCGHSFVVEEKRREPSGFDKMDSTVQLGQTMYNQMLSDMGLNIARQANVPEKRVEVIAPVASAASPAAAKPREATPAAKPANNYKFWFILGGVLLALGFLVIIAAAVLLYLFLPR